MRSDAKRCEAMPSAGHTQAAVLSGRDESRRGPAFFLFSVSLENRAQLLVSHKKGRCSPTRKFFETQVFLLMKNSGVLDLKFLGTDIFIIMFSDKKKRKKWV